MQNLRILAVAALFLGFTETPIHAQESWKFLDPPEGEPYFVALSPSNPVVFVENPGKVSKMAFLAQVPITGYHLYTTAKLGRMTYRYISLDTNLPSNF